MNKNTRSFLAMLLALLLLQAPMASVVCATAFADDEVIIEENIGNPASESVGEVSTDVHAGMNSNNTDVVSAPEEAPVESVTEGSFESVTEITENIANNELTAGAIQLEVAETETQTEIQYNENGSESLEKTEEEDSKTMTEEVGADQTLEAAETADEPNVEEVAYAEDDETINGDLSVLTNDSSEDPIVTDEFVATNENPETFESNSEAEEDRKVLTEETDTCVSNTELNDSEIEVSIDLTNEGNESDIAAAVESEKISLGMANAVATLNAETQSGLDDSTGPTLINVELSKTEVTAPDEIEVIVEATDDVSGLRSGILRFQNEETESAIFVSVSATYYVEVVKSYIEDDGYEYEYYDYEERVYEDGKLHGTMSIGQYAASGVYKISYIDLYDNAGNSTYYYSNAYTDNMPEILQDCSFTVENDTPDFTPPTIIDISVEKNVIAAPDVVEVIVSAMDDVSGLRNANIGFKNEETGVSLYVTVSATYYVDIVEEYLEADGSIGYCYIGYEERTYEDGKLHGTMKIGQYASSGIYKINYIDLYDNAGNSTYYYSNTYTDNMPEILQDCSFTVENDTPDCTPPTLVDVSIEKNIIETPDVVEIIVSAMDDVSGLRNATIGFKNEQTESSLFVTVSATYYVEIIKEVIEADGTSNYYYDVEERTYEDGKLHGTMKIGQYTATGVYRINYIDIYDNAGNGSFYYSNPYVNNLSEALSDFSFTVVNTGRLEENTNFSYPYYRELIVVFVEANSQNEADSKSSIDVEIVGDKAVLTLSADKDEIIGQTSNLQALQNSGIHTLVIKTQYGAFSVSVSDLLRILNEFGANEYTLRLIDGNLEVWINGEKVDIEVLMDEEE